MQLFPYRQALSAEPNVQSKRSLLASLAILLLFPPPAGADPQALVDIGAMLFFDTNLSVNRTQACATCHDPGRAFTDGRKNLTGGAASLGADGQSLGDRNTPTLTYIHLTPAFELGAAGKYRGGFFLDGRAATLAIQALEPLTNPLEMALPSREAIVARLKANPAYVEQFSSAFGAHVFDKPEHTLLAIGESIAAFEQTEQFASFDSKYDRHLRNEYTMEPLEEMGRSLFFSPMTNCSSCHLLHVSAVKAKEPFTSYQYHNIGIPANKIARRHNRVEPSFKDIALAGNPLVHEPDRRGRFKVPTLRNVAVTAPYMHNGIFSDLSTAILFYNKYTVHSTHSDTNPETGRPWGAPEIAETISVELLNEGQPIDSGRARALVAFLKTLTDARYEALLTNEPNKGLVDKSRALVHP